MITTKFSRRNFRRSVPGNNGFQTVNEASLHICNPQANRLYIHQLVYPGQRLSCAFPNEVACARFLHDGSEVQLERHGAQAAHVQSFYKTGCEGVSYFKLPAVKPDVVNPVIEIIFEQELINK